MSKKVCKVDSCIKDAESKGYCGMHYSRWMRHGDPLFTKYHRMRGTREYTSWRAMKERCSNKNNKMYSRYGGRGIAVCDRWKNSFENFIKDMGKKPFQKAQIDRIDNDGNYEPENCRWVSCEENNRNKSNVKLTEEIALYIRLSRKSGKYVKDISKELKIKPCTIYDVLLNRSWIKRGV